jgi:imidazolonepropionase-like amidohydrolase
MIISGGRVIDGDGRPPVEADVVIEGDLIIAVGPETAGGDRSSAGAATTRIDATGCIVMPGLIDAHVHVTFDEPQSNDELFFHRDHTLAALATAHHLPKMLLAGVTSIMDPDTIFRMGPSIRTALEVGLIEGPRMATGVAALLTSVGGTAGRLIPDEGDVGYARVVLTRDEMVLETRRQVKEGADWIKIHATGSIPNRAGELQVWTLDEMRAVCETAHDLGVGVTAHCRNAGSTRDAALAGVDLILHASFMDEAALEAVVASGAAICPTFTFLANLCDHGSLVGAASDMVDVFRGEIQATAAVLRSAFDAGVPILCGSESGFVLTPYGEWHAREMEVLVDELGLTPLEAIRCATHNGAIAMRMNGRVGRIAPDHVADVVVVDGDPSQDVTVLGDRRNLREVVSRGRRVDLDRPWPTHRPLPGAHVRNWAETALTFDLTRP